MGFDIDELKLEQGDPQAKKNAVTQRALDLSIDQGLMIVRKSGS